MRGRGRGGGQRAGYSGQGGGRRGGPFAAGPEGFCSCPGCGFRQAHERGIPCTQVRCPKCGANMVREITEREGG